MNAGEQRYEPRSLCERWDCPGGRSRRFSAGSSRRHWESPYAERNREERRLQPWDPASRQMHGLTNLSFRRLDSQPAPIREAVEQFGEEERLRRAWEMATLADRRWQSERAHTDPWDPAARRDTPSLSTDGRSMVESGRARIAASEPSGSMEWDDIRRTAYHESFMPDGDEPTRGDSRRSGNTQSRFRLPEIEDKSQSGTNLPPRESKAIVGTRGTFDIRSPKIEPALEIERDSRAVLGTPEASRISPRSQSSQNNGGAMSQSIQSTDSGIFYTPPQTPLRSRSLTRQEENYSSNDTINRNNLGSTVSGSLRESATSRRSVEEAEVNHVGRQTNTIDRESVVPYSGLPYVTGSDVFRAAWDMIEKSNRFKDALEKYNKEMAAVARLSKTTNNSFKSSSDSRSSGEYRGPRESSYYSLAEDPYTGRALITGSDVFRTAWAMIDKSNEFKNVLEVYTNKVGSPTSRSATSLSINSGDVGSTGLKEAPVPSQKYGRPAADVTSSAQMDTPRPSVSNSLHDFPTHLVTPVTSETLSTVSNATESLLSMKNVTAGNSIDSNKKRSIDMRHSLRKTNSGKSLKSTDAELNKEDSYYSVRSKSEDTDVKMLQTPIASSQPLVQEDSLTEQLTVAAFQTEEPASQTQSIRLAMALNHKGIQAEPYGHVARMMRIKNIDHLNVSQMYVSQLFATESSGTAGSASYHSASLEIRSNEDTRLNGDWNAENRSARITLGDTSSSDTSFKSTITALYGESSYYSALDSADTSPNQLVPLKGRHVPYTARQVCGNNSDSSKELAVMTYEKADVDTQTDIVGVRLSLHDKSVQIQPLIPMSSVMSLCSVDDLKATKIHMSHSTNTPGTFNTASKKKYLQSTEKAEIENYNASEVRSQMETASAKTKRSSLASLQSQRRENNLSADSNIVDQDSFVNTLTPREAFTSDSVCGVRIVEIDKRDGNYNVLENERRASNVASMETQQKSLASLESRRRENTSNIDSNTGQNSTVITCAPKETFGSGPCLGVRIVEIDKQERSYNIPEKEKRYQIAESKETPRVSFSSLQSGRRENSLSDNVTVVTIETEEVGIQTKSLRSDMKAASVKKELASLQGRERALGEEQTVVTLQSKDVSVQTGSLWSLPVVTYGKAVQTGPIVEMEQTIRIRGLENSPEDEVTAGGFVQKIVHMEAAEKVGMRSETKEKRKDW